MKLTNSAVKAIQDSRSIRTESQARQHLHIPYNEINQTEENRENKVVLFVS